MPSIQIDPRVFNAALAALLTGLVGVAPLVVRRNRLIWLFALSNISLAVWNLGDVVVLLPESHSMKLWLFRLNYFSAVFVVWFFYLFMLEFSNVQMGKFKNVWKTLKLSGIGLLLLSPTPYLVKNIDDSVRPFKEIPGPLYPLFILFFVSGAGIALYQVFLGFMKASRFEKNRFEYVFGALFLIFVEAIFFFLTLYFKTIPPYYFYLQVAYALILAYAIVTHRVMGFTLLSRNAISWLVTVVCSILPFIASAYLASLLWDHPHLALNNGPGPLICAVICSSLVLALCVVFKSAYARALCAFLVLLSLWNFSAWALFIQHKSVSIWIYRLGYSVSCYVLLSWFLFWYRYFNLTSEPNDKFRRLFTWMVIFVSLVVGLSPFVLQTLEFSGGQTNPAIIIPGPLHSLFSIWFLIMAGASAISPFLTWRKTDNEVKLKIGVLMFGAQVLGVLAVATYFLFVDAKWPWFWYPTLELFTFVFLVGALVLRIPSEMGNTPRLWALRIGGFTLSVFTVSLLVGFLLAQNNRFMAAGGFLVAIAVLILANKIHAPIRDWIDQTPLFREGVGYIAKAKEAASRRPELESLEKALPLLVQDLIQVVPYGSITVAVMFDDMPRRPFFCSSYVRTVGGELIQGTPWSGALVFEFLKEIRRTGDLLLREEAKDLSSLVLDLSSVVFEAAVPLRNKDNVVGFVVFGQKKGGRNMFHHEDIKILKSLADSINQQLANSIALNRFRILVNNTLHDVISHQIGPVNDQVGIWPFVPDHVLEERVEKVRSIIGLAARQQDITGEIKKLDFGAAPGGYLKERIRTARQMLIDLRAYAQGELEAPKVTVFLDMENLLKTVYAVHKVFAERKGLQFLLTMPPSLPRPRLDPLLAERCVGNLVTNAIKYTEQGTVEISARVEEKYLTVCVADTGIGIPRESLERIFEEGYRVPGKAMELAEGTGVGLANVQDIMAALGGRIKVESELGKGSRFFLYFSLPGEQDASKA